jgi:hypothetical protein
VLGARMVCQEVELRPPSLPPSLPSSLPPSLFKKWGAVKEESGRELMSAWPLDGMPRKK